MSLFDQGKVQVQVQVLRAAVAGLTPEAPGAAIVNAIGPLREVVTGPATASRRYLVVAPGTPDRIGTAVQVQR